jgi:hypothetical protein
VTAKMTQGKPGSERPPGRLARVGVECPRCHFRQFIEIEFDQWPPEAPAAAEIHKHLAEWIVSRCPDHLSLIAAASKN